jgi:hypothetical protein
MRQGELGGLARLLLGGHTHPGQIRLGCTDKDLAGSDWLHKAGLSWIILSCPPSLHLVRRPGSNHSWVRR